MTPAGMLLLIGCLCAITEPAPQTNVMVQPPSPLYSAQTIFASRPYQFYFLLKVVFSFGTLVHKGMETDFIQYVLSAENVALFESLLQPLTLMGAYAGSFLTYRLAAVPKAYLSSCMLCFHALVFGVGATVSKDTMRHTYIQTLTFLNGAIQRLLSVAFQGMTSDVIDYDRLVTGLDRSAVFVSIDHSAEGIFGLVGEPIPQFVIAALGYQNNGGCDCGCGVLCHLPYLRWSCPLDIGYACTRSFNHNPLFFGDPFRVPACTLQSPVVVAAIKRFYLVAPVIFSLTASMIALLFPIDANVSHEISIGHNCRKIYGWAYDPVERVNLAPIKTGTDLYVERAYEQFSKSEAELIRRDRHGVYRIVMIAVSNMTVVILCAFCVLYYAIVASHIREFAAMAITLVPFLALLAISWNALKVHAILRDRSLLLRGVLAASDNAVKVEAPDIAPELVESLMQWRRRSCHLR